MPPRRNPIDLERIREQMAEEAELVASLRYQDFTAGFKRSRRDNLYRFWQGKTVCVFERDDGWYGWSISAGRGQVRFSPRAWEDEGEALADLWETLEGGEG
jgi:hypothetical protein